MPILPLITFVPRESLSDFYWHSNYLAKYQALNERALTGRLPRGDLLVTQAITVDL